MIERRNIATRAARPGGVGPSTIATSPAEWTEEALCIIRHRDDDWWFSDNQEMARQVCQECPVMERCAQIAARNREQHGIWGGQDFGQHDRCKHGHRYTAENTRIRSADGCWICRKCSAISSQGQRDKQREKVICDAESR